MLELQNDAAIMCFVAKNYKRIKKECETAQQETKISSDGRIMPGEKRNPRGTNQYSQKTKKPKSKQLRVEFNRKKAANSFEGRVIGALGCSREKAKRAKKIIELLRQKKISRDVVLKIMCGQISLREALYDCGCVYLLSWRNLIKIGCTKLTAEERAKQIARTLPPDKRGVELLGCIKTSDPYLLEKRLHAQYATKKVAGEWFALSDTDIADIFSTFES